MVAFNLSFIKMAQLYNYQIQDVVYDLHNDKIQFRLANYFAGCPGIKVTVKYFKLGSNPKYSIVISDTDDIEHRMTSNVEKTVESLTESIADNLKDDLEKEIENANNNKKHKRILVSGPL